MKKIITILFLVSFFLVNSQNGITPLDLWSYKGNTFPASAPSNTFFFGTKSNHSLIFKTNNNIWRKLDSVGISRDYTTAATSTVSGTNWLNSATTNGWTWYLNDATNSGYHTNWKNANGGIGIYLSNSGGTRTQMGSISNDAFGLYVNGGTPAVRISTASNVGIGTVADQTAKLTIAGTTSATSNFTLNGNLLINPTASTSILTGTYSSIVPAIYLGTTCATPNSTNYFVIKPNTSTQINDASRLRINIADATVIDVQTGAMYANGKLRVGSTSAASATLDVTGTMSVSSTTSLNGLNLSTGNIQGNGTNFTIDNSVFGNLILNGTTGSSVKLNIAGSNILSAYATSVVIVQPILAQSNFTNSARFETKQGVSVASLNGAITLGGDGNVFEITGTNAITLINNTSWQDGSEITLLFTSTASLTDGTANSGSSIGFELAGNANFTGSADDSITLTLCTVGGTQRWREKCRSVN